MPTSYPNVHCDGSCATVKELLPRKNERERIRGKCDGKRGTAVPIRFRCAYCNQLMGISRRKAGTVVRCPTCSGQVVVPPENEPAAPLPAGPSKGGPDLF